MNSKIIRVGTLALFLFGLGWSNLVAGRLPIRTYTAADGLGSGRINNISFDSRGFLWAGTREGLSRFDGNEFTTYGVEHGLPDNTVRPLIQTARGTYLVMTNDALVSWCDPPADSLHAASSKNESRGLTFQVCDGIAATSLLALDRKGRAWGCESGAMVLFDEATKQFAQLPDSRFSDSLMIGYALADDGSAIWIGTQAGVIRWLPNGRKIYYALPEDKEDFGRVEALMFDRDGRLWIGNHNAGLHVFMPDPIGRFEDSARSLVKLRQMSPKDLLPGVPGTVALGVAKGLTGPLIISLRQSSDGHMWIGTGAGLVQFDGKQFRKFTTENGLSNNRIHTIAEDSYGNIWLGSDDGLMKLGRPGFTSFRNIDGIQDRALSVYEDTEGYPVVVSGSLSLSRFDGTKFTTVKAILPMLGSISWSVPGAFLDSRNRWWLLTTKGLGLLPAKFTWKEDQVVVPERTFTQRDGLPDDAIFRLFEDRRQNLWVSFTNSGTPVRIDKETNEIHQISEFPVDGNFSSFCEDNSGTKWFGLYRGGLARFRAGEWTVFGEADSLPQTMITALHQDQAYRLWIATNKEGLSEIVEDSSGRINFIRYNDQKLSSNNIRCITEDAQGRLYLGHTRGVDMLDISNRQVKQFSTADGLAGDFVVAGLKDRHGRLWFASSSGVSVLDPAEGRKGDNYVPVYIYRLTVGGNSVPIPDMGTRTVHIEELNPDQNQIRVEYGAPDFESGKIVTYQHVLEGAERSWSEPTKERTVHLAGLAPGSYRLLLRSFRDGGLNPASISFTILPPFYLRWWFVTLSLFFVVGIAYVAERLRVRKLLEIERIRARIASDLHDDIGSSLTSIVMTAELPGRESGKGSDATARLNSIAASARETLDGIAAIVWAINPQNDELENLVGYIRGYVATSLEQTDIDVGFDFPADVTAVKVTAEFRRNVFLLFKEAIHNVIKHARPAHVWLSLSIEDSLLKGSIKDDGAGFATSDVSRFRNGLRNMKKRMEDIGGECSIESELGKGTVVSFRVRIDHVR
ncbi:MAG TPA: two-component regulator propeller domain-containing protein [Bacteroidota bacterium]